MAAALTTTARFTVTFAPEVWLRGWRYPLLRDGNNRLLIEPSSSFCAVTGLKATFKAATELQF